MLQKNILAMAGIGVLGTALLFLTVVPMLATSGPGEEEPPAQEGPSPADVPIIEDDFSNLPYPPSRDLPSTGNPTLRAWELAEKPEIFNQVKLSEEAWLQDAIAANMQGVSMDEKSVDEFDAFYEKVNNEIQYFEVTFPDGSVKYYTVTYYEVP